MRRSRRENDGWSYPFRQRPWEDLDREFDSWSTTHPEFQHMFAIVTSVREACAVEVLAASTSMHDLLVLPTPLPDPPYDVVAVRPPTRCSRWLLAQFSSSTCP